MAAAFVLTTALSVLGVVNIPTAVGEKLYESATNKVGEELYDCKPVGLYKFLQLVSNRTRASFRWDDKIGGILQIPVDPTDPNSDMDNLIDNYGRIALAEI
jgi:hypothetical protein